MVRHLGVRARNLAVSAAFAAAAVVLSGSAAHAAYDIPQHVIAGGGGTSTGGTYSLTGTIGQSIVGFSTGGNYELSGGFWGGGAPSGGIFDITVFVALAGTGSGSVSSNPAGISCPPTCNSVFTDVPSVALTGTPTNAGSAFTGWLGACSGKVGCTLASAGTKNVSATFAPNDGYAFKLDIDKNNAYDALTDGLLMLRYLFGLTGTPLTQNAIGPNAQLSSPSGILTRLSDIRPLLDIDGNGQPDALSDGLLLIRYLFGLRGGSLVANAIGPGAIRTNPAEIEAHILSLLPPP
jgi:hypothetical protein